MMLPISECFIITYLIIHPIFKRQIIVCRVLIYDAVPYIYISENHL